MLQATEDKITPKKEAYARSQSLKDKLEVLKAGTTLYKIRDKGLRGIQLYKRKYWLDLENLEIRFTPHKEGKSKIPGCASKEEGDSFYSLKDICEVRTEYSTDIFNTISSKTAHPKYRKVSPMTAFSLIFAPESNLHELDLVAEDLDVRNLWVDGISHLVLTLRSISDQKEYELYLKNAFRKADENRSGALNLSEVKDLCKLLNVKVEKDEMARLFNLANTDKGDLNNKDKGQVLNEEEFLAFYYKLMARPDIQTIFSKYSTKTGVEPRMSAESLVQFFQEEQKIPLSREECRGIIRNHEVSEDKTTFSCAGFLQFIMFSRLQDVMDPVERSQVRDDMTQPLAHYWIASSHNTYLTGNQLTGESSIDGYIAALKLGCRCVELDCWDGEDGEPIIYHGYTLTSKILFKDVIQAVHKYGFNSSHYPLILSIENHCSIEQQDKMADHLVKILGPQLQRGEPDQDLDHLPAPNQLINKVLVKAKRLPPGTSQDEAEEEDEDEDERDDAKKKKSPKIAGKLSALVNYIHAVHFKGLNNQDAKYFHMSSFGESKTNKLLSDHETARDFVRYNTQQISRIYPGAKRQDSSNLKIMPALVAGCQIVALNYQTDDRQNLLNRAWFSGNGGCGYVLKPEFLRNPSIHYNPTKLNGLPKSKFPGMVLEVEVVSGQHIPRPQGSEEGEVIDPYVQLHIRGHADDFENEENHVETAVVRNNGFNPVWRETFKFSIRVPDLAVLEMKIKDHSKSNKDHHLGSVAVPLKYLQQGYRKATLVDYSGRELKPASLFLRINKHWD